MLTRADIAAAALALPEAYGSSHFDVADFRVNKKIFCTVHADVPRMVLKLDPEDQHNLADGEAIERIPNKWGAAGWTYVWFEKLAPERLPGLLRMAWAQVAPKRLLK